MEKEEVKNTKLTSTIEEDSKRPYPPLDYTITNPQERNKKVHEIVNSVSSEKLTYITPYFKIFTN